MSKTWYHEKWPVGEFVKDTDLKVKDIIKELRDVLAVKHI